MIRLFLELTKFRLSAAVTLSALLTFVVAGGDDAALIAYSVLAVLLLALGVSALNQYQEHESDSKMARTKRRPIPSGRISPYKVLTLSMILILSSMFLIYYKLGNIGLLLFLFVPLWYNGFYTSLKRRSAFAVVPGGLLGVIPPAIGWLSAGRSLQEPEFLALGLLFFVWQVPHFWLLMTKYDKDYRAAGFPTIIETFGEKGTRLVLFVWWILTICSALFVIAMFGVNNIVLSAILIILVTFAAFSAVRLVLEPLSSSKAGMLFKKINIFLFGIMVLLSIDAF